ARKSASGRGAARGGAGFCPRAPQAAVAEDSRHQLEGRSSVCHPTELPVVTEPRLRPAVGRAKETFTSRGQTYWQSRPVPAPPPLADAERPAGRSTHLRSSPDLA